MQGTVTRTRELTSPGFASKTRPHLGPWLRALAGLCLAAAVAGGAVIVAGGSTSGAHAHTLPPAPSEPCPLPSIGGRRRRPRQRSSCRLSRDDKQVRLTWAAGRVGNSLRRLLLARSGQ